MYLYQLCIQYFYFVCDFVWLRNLVSHTKGGTYYINIILSTLLSDTLSPCSALMPEFNFHTHTEPQGKL
jgi:hypothetical protein